MYIYVWLFQLLSFIRYLHLSNEEPMKKKFKAMVSYGSGSCLHQLLAVFDTILCFQHTDPNTIRKKECASPACGPTCNAEGCLNRDESYTVGVTAKSTGYLSDGSFTDYFTVSVNAAREPTFSFSGELYRLFLVILSAYCYCNEF
jgi:hypothetical protein